ncbi:MAG: hypothetical protein Q8N10_13050 [Phenylobacterium sp.]|uniref:hypothetical protein n=1 Tax=Phenylobacterium sp. TaxID=1871053 RepID=UPI00272879E4|nr:hypothetical protein [Phenylobacterium sp.]MDO8913103.1 hypothetical protein [Phenylobacterium sp.]MDP3101411.1 hypothetical protein [Phenylobacterium sp.]
MTEAEVAKRRFTVMVAVSAASVFVAIAAIVCAFRFSQSWLLVVFGMALLIGFGAQIWFIAGSPPAKKGV